MVNTNDLLVSDLHYLSNTLTNTDNKADDFTKEDDNLISQQVDNVDKYSVNGVPKWQKIECIS